MSSSLAVAVPADVDGGSISASNARTNGELCTLMGISSNTSLNDILALASFSAVNAWSLNAFTNASRRRIALKALMPLLVVS